MSDNASSSPARLDRRVLRTRDRLGDAIIELLLEKPFEEVTVQEVLARAHVSRSTFYTHYRDKDDLLLSDIDDFLEWMATLLVRQGGPSPRLAPVAEFCAHIGESRDLYRAIVDSGKMHEFRQLGEGHFARAIEQRLLQRQCAVPPSERAMIANALAGAIFSLLTWWVNHGMTPTAQEMDDLFHRVIVPEKLGR